MHIKDHNDAMKFFRTYDNVASKGKWKEFVDEMEFDSMLQEPRTMAQEPRNMAHGGQLVQNTDDGSRPGYGGAAASRILKFIKEFKIKNPFKIPTLNEIRQGTGSGSKTIKNLLNERTDFIVTPSKDVATAAGLKSGAKRKEIVGSVSEVSLDLAKEVKDIDVKGISVAIETATYGNKFIRLRLTDDAIKIFGEEWLPATKENLKKIKTKIKKIKKSSEYRDVKPFKTAEYFRKLDQLKEARYRKQDPFRIYGKLQEYKKEKFPGSMSSNIQIQHGQPKFTTQTLSRWGLIPKKVQTIEAVVRAERIRNELLSSALVKLKNPKRSIADKEKIIEKFNDTMKGLKGQLKGTEGQGLVNFELLKLDKAGNVVKLKDVGFNPKKGLAYGDELGELDFAKISQEQADQIIALGKEKIDLELLRKVLPSKLKNIVNPTPLSRYYETGGRVGFRDGSGDIKAGEKGNVEKIKKILNKKGINLKSGEAGSIATDMLKDFGKMGLKGGKLLRWLQLEYDVLFESLIYQYHRQYKGHEPELAREALWLPKIIAKYAPNLWEKVGFEPFKTGVWEGPEKILEEELIGENKLVKNYIDNNKRMEEISSEWDQIDTQKKGSPRAQPTPEQVKSFENQQAALAEEYNQLDQLNKPDSVSGYHSAYTTALEAQETEYGVKRTEAHKKRLGVKDYPWDIENPNEMLKYDKNKERKLEGAQKRFESEQANKRRRALEDKYPTLSKHEIDKMLEASGYVIDPDIAKYKKDLKFLTKDEVYNPYKPAFPPEVEAKPVSTYDIIRGVLKDQDKLDYFADNFRMEKADGGLTRTVAPGSGGIASLKKKW